MKSPFSRISPHTYKDIALIFAAPAAVLFASALTALVGNGLALHTALTALVILAFSQYVHTAGRRMLLTWLSVTAFAVAALFSWPVGARPPLVLVIGIVVCLLLIGRLTVNLRQMIEEQQKKSDLESERRQMMSEFNTRLMLARGMEEIGKELLLAIFELSGRSSVLFMANGGCAARVGARPAGLIIFKHELAAVCEAARRGKMVGVGTGICTFSPFRYYPLSIENKVMCVVGVLLGTEGYDEPSVQLIDQLIQRGAIAFERQVLIDEQQDIITEKHMEQLRANFLRAVSHDLRSPLAAIVGACAALEQSLGDTPNTRQLLADIREESVWLTHMVENLLSVTRVSAEGPKLSLSAEAAEEIVGEAAYKCVTRFPSLKLNVAVPDQVIILRMDATLITQVILNLVENAVKYGGGSSVELTVVRRGRDAVFAVRDYGDGVPQEKMEDIFAGKGYEAGDSRHGLGIGLSICRTVVLAHGGDIWVENCPEGGARFSFSLPVEEEDS